MFSVEEKREISRKVQEVLRATNHPELPPMGEIGFSLHVDGAESWSWADIRNNGAVPAPGLYRLRHSKAGHGRKPKVRK